MKRFLVKSTFSLVGLLLIMLGVDIFMTNNLKHSNCLMFNTYNEIYTDTISADAIVMGTSRGWVQFNPAILDSILGVNSYNISVDGKAVEAQVAMYNLYRRHAPKPKLIIQEVYYNTLGNSTGYQREQYTPYFTCDQALWNDIRRFEDYTLLHRFIPLIRYAGYTNLIKEGIGAGNALDDGDLYKGFHPVDHHWDGSLFAKIKSVQFAHPSYQQDIFDRYLERCKSDSIEVILVLAPIYIGVTEKMQSPQEMFDYYQHMADKYSFTLLNYTYDTLCYDTAFFYNATHLNSRGADLFSLKLSEDIRDLHLPLFREDTKDSSSATRHRGI